MNDPTDRAIEALVTLREHGTTRTEALDLVSDVYAAPWSDDASAVAEVHRIGERMRAAS